MPLYQLFLQNKKDIENVEFLRQFEASNFDMVNEVLYEERDRLLEQTGEEIPKGWQLMICTEESHYFLKTIYTPENN